MGFVLVLTDPCYLRAPWRHAKLLLVAFLGCLRFADLFSREVMAVRPDSDAATGMAYLALGGDAGFARHLILSPNPTPGERESPLTGRTRGNGKKLLGTQ